MIIDRFLRWAATAPVGLRADAASALARAYLYSDVGEDEREGIEAALTVLMDDMSAVVRGAIAEALAGAPEAPRHLILTLAADQPDVAAPILERSPLLEDGDLVDLVATGDEPAQIAICRRQGLSPAVAAAAAEVVTTGAALALLDAQGARLPRFVLRRLASRFADEADVRTALFGLPTLPADTRQALLERLSEHLGAFAAERSWLDGARAARIAREACDRATLSIADDCASEALVLVRHLRSTGRLTATLLLRSVLANGLAFFEAALAELAAVPPERVAAILSDGRPGPFRSLCERAGLPPRTIPAFQAAIVARRACEPEKVSLGRYRLVRRLGEAVLSAIDASDDDLADLRALVRRVLAEAARDAARDYAADVAA